MIIIHRNDVLLFLTHNLLPREIQFLNASVTEITMTKVHVDVVLLNVDQSN